MKRILYLMFLLPSMAFAQLQDSVFVKFPTNEAGEVVYSEVVETKNTKEQIFKNAQTWMSKTFGDYKAIIQVQDLATGNLIFKGRSVEKIEGGLANDGIAYTVQIEVKPTKFRIRISNISSVFSTRSSVGDSDLTPIEQYYKKQITRVDQYAHNAPRLLREKDAQARALLASIKKNLLMNDDF